MARRDRNQVAIDVSRIETTRGMIRDLMATGERIRETALLKGDHGQDKCQEFQLIRTIGTDNYQYYGIRCNTECLNLMSYRVKRAWHYWLNRRGGRKMTWRAFGRMMEAYPLPRPRVVNGQV